MELASNKTASEASRKDVSSTAQFQVDSLPRPPGSVPTCDVVPVRAVVSLPEVRAVVRKPALDVLADWLLAYGSGVETPVLSDVAYRSYLEPSRPVMRTRSTVFGDLIPGSNDAPAEVV